MSLIKCLCVYVFYKTTFLLLMNRMVMESSFRISLCSANILILKSSKVTGMDNGRKWPRVRPQRLWDIQTVHTSKFRDVCEPMWLWFISLMRDLYSNMFTLKKNWWSHCLRHFEIRKMQAGYISFIFIAGIWESI